LTKHCKKTKLFDCEYRVLSISISISTLLFLKGEMTMRAVTFKKGSLKEGIAIRRINDRPAITLGYSGEKNGKSIKSILSDPDNPPLNKYRRISSASLLSLTQEDGKKTFLLTGNINNGCNRKRNGKELIRINTFYPYFEDGKPQHFGGSWSTTKGSPLLLAEVCGGDGQTAWTDSLIVMSPGDVINVSYRRPGMRSFFLSFERTHRWQRLTCHDSHYYLISLNERRPVDLRERKKLRLLKKIGLSLAD